MAGFVAVSVLAYQTGDVHLGPSGSTLRGREEGVELGAESLVPAHQRNMSVDVMGSEETVLPGIGLGIMVVDLRRLERREPAAAHHRTHQAGLRVPDIDVTGRIFQVPVADIRITLLPGLPVDHIGHLRDAPVIVGILEGLRHRLMLLLRRHDIPLTVVADTELVLARGLHHRLQQLRRILQPYPMAQGLGYHGCGVVSDHAVGLPAAEFPYRQLAALPPDGQEGTQEVLRPLRLNQRQHRMQGSESIPEGKYGIAVKSLRPVHLPVHSPVFPADIGEEIRGYGRVVQCSIEGPHPLAVPPALSADIDLREILLPKLLRGGPPGIEVKAVLRHIAQEVLPGIVRRH